MKWFIQALKNYTNFSGRARRKEYWYFVLFYYIFYIVLGVASVGLDVEWPIIVFVLAMLLPYLAVTVRRMHDTGHSGWYMFIPIYNLILACTNGDQGNNGWGGDPKQPELYEEINMIGANPQV